MGILGTNSTLVADIEKATSANNTQEKWGLIMEVCDKVTNGAVNPKDCLKVVVKRLNHSDPHVVMQAITLLDACVSNCGKQFHLEVASREFENEFKKLMQKSQATCSKRLRLCLKKWAESDFKSDPQLNLIPSLYQKLRSEGHDFSEPSATPKREPPVSKDPNVVSSQQEEDDIAKAIELSLKETKSGSGTGASSNQSPQFGGSSSGGTSSLYPTAMLTSIPAVEPRKVRALYDFEAAEDNELTFQAGEIIFVLDDGDPNWWKGQNQRGEGLFPSNFVSSDLNAEPEASGAVGGKGTKKNVQFSDEQPTNEDDKQGSAGNQTVDIDEEKIDRLLHLLHEADPEDPSTDSEEMLRLEQVVNQMGPLIDTELERVDRKHAQLTQLSSDLVEAINLYHTLMREPDRSMMMGPAGPYGMPGFPGPSTMPSMYQMPGMYGAQNMPTGMFPGMPGMPGTLPPYSLPQLRHDIGQMSINSVPQFPPPQQTMPPSISQNGPPTNLPGQQIPTSAAPVGPGQPQMHAGIPPQAQQSMPNIAMPPQHSNPAPPHPMMSMSHMQPNFTNPTSPPPVSNAPSTAIPPQPQPPQPSNQIGSRPLPNQQPQLSQPQQQPIPQANYSGFGPGLPNGQPPSAQQQVQVATAPLPHHHPGAPMAPGAFPPYMQMPPGTMGGPFPPPNHHPAAMLHGMMSVGPPPGSPLSINTVASSSPQNIPIYQQQR
ncbi:signal transducing adapter molecule 1 [Uranotaenia lowii]|uniref:signal transducing adapter molecule 1 n=1 Tax=Uranotaenia lowii TaxID=190385 RepID=UPI00247B213E|nr:signal transducing adapter molecule 1 [Uranotaenia lowii]